MPCASVVIPTHNRSAVLRRSLDAFLRQTFPFDSFEVVVVADGCVDDTVEVARGFNAPFQLSFLETPGEGPAAARNKGAAAARGGLLIFIDDDVEVTPGFVEAHVLAHQKQSGVIVLGYLPPVLSGQSGFFRTALRTWWEAMFDRMRQRGHRFRYTDLLSGNFSLSARLFKSLGGFDPNFLCHEDYELGMRAIKAGIFFRFESRAAGDHHELTDLNRALQRKFQEGQADIQLGQLYPELREDLLLARLYHFSRFLSRILRAFTFSKVFVGDLLVGFLERSLHFLEWARMRKTWRRVLDGLMAYWYWRGVAQKLKSSEQVEIFLKEGRQACYLQDDQVLAIDLSRGLEAAENQLDSTRPAGLLIRYGTHWVGSVKPVPSAEALRGVHLRRILAGPLLRGLSSAVALAGGTYILEGKTGIPAKKEKTGITL